MVLAKPVSAKDFSLPLLGGGNRSLSSLKGKIVLLNFWATWCPPCREEMPSMETLYNKFKNEGLEFLTVTVDSKDAEEEVKAFMRSLRLSFPVALDPPGKVFALYNVRSIPTTYIVDRNGNIVAGAVGSRNWNSGEVSTAFEALLRRGP
ncbi:MAG: TlpA family protein disulfide reductase [Spirochaetales bacterium]|jgi:peroxiredoxin|nr:TlpA family protein disulfide reductase [Spirochaetales bacterium]